ncbi:hypothetical protein QZH41_018487, partial [Actinostola sp. cb2023]
TVQAVEWREENGERREENGEKREENGERREENGEKREENGERREENGERREENGERREENGERRKENGERREENGERNGRVEWREEREERRMEREERRIEREENGERREENGERRVERGERRVDRLVENEYSTNRYLTPGTQIDFRVRWNSPAVALMSGDATLTNTPKFKIVPQSPAMWIYHVETNPELHLRNEVAMLQNQQIAFYPMEEKRIVTHTIINGRLREKFSNLFTGFRPNYMIVGLLRGDAYTGSYTHNPFNFADMGQKQIKVTIDGEELPYPPIVLDSHDKCEGYATFANFAGKFFDSQSNGISRKDYKDGNYLLLWNFNPDGALNSGYVYGRTLGNVAIDIEFRTPTADNTTLVIIDVVGLYPPNRGTHTNYTYVGTKAADEALAELERLQQGPDHEEWGMVFNIDPAHRPGQHWLVLYSPAGEKTVECMDSYGTPEASRYPDSPEAQTILRRVSPVKSPRLQSHGTFACGHYCLAYLYARTHDKPPQRFVAPFSSTEHVANDRTVCRFVCSVMIPKRLRPAFTAAYVGPLGSPCQGCCCPKEVNEQ